MLLLPQNKLRAIVTLFLQVRAKHGKAQRLIMRDGVRVFQEQSACEARESAAYA